MMSPTKVFLLESKEGRLLQEINTRARNSTVGQCRKAAVRVLVMTPLVLSIVLFAIYLQGFTGFPTLVANHNGEFAAAGDAETINRDIKMFLHPEDHISRDPEVLRFSWNITKAPIAPDGVKKDVFLINNEFPGPTIEARSGDILVIDAWNLAEEGLSLHWHGLHLRGANQMDGPVGITQCTIETGAKFTYRVPIGEQAGTFWYHAHSEVQRGDGLYGALIVHSPSSVVNENSDRYDEEILLLVGDWYHRPAEKVLSWFQDRTSMGNEPVPDSLLINGLGYFDCSKITHGPAIDCSKVDLPRLSLEKELRYRVRLVNVGSMAGISITVPDSDIQVIQVDGGLSVNAAVANSIGVLYPGERVDFILSWSRSVSDMNTQITIELDKELFLWSNLALTRIQSFLLEADSNPQNQVADHTELRPMNLREVTGLQLAKSLPEPEARFMIYTTLQVLNQLEDEARGLINRTFWEPQNVPLVASEREAWNNHQLVPWTGAKPIWVELTINNVDVNGHPFHMHGYDFYVVASYEGKNGGYNAYNPFDTSMPPRGGPFNLANPIRKDTVYVPPSGYVVLRFYADNPGIWALHCHILWHQASGMVMALQVLGDETRGFSEDTIGIEALKQCRT